MGEHPSGAVVVLNVPPGSELIECGEDVVLKENLRAMVNNADYSDVQFVCSDGGRVHACRMLLVARSSVLKSLLTNGMSESKLTEIPLPDITTAAMLTIVEYLYTGMIVSNKLTMVSAFQSVHASRFLMLDKLEKCVMHILVAAVNEVTDAELLAWCFTQLAEMSTGGEGMPHSVASETSDLVRDMARKMEAMESHPLTRLSVPAMNLYLDATQSKSITVSLKAYLRLRSILFWAGGRVSLLAEDVLRGCLPDEKYLREAFHAQRKVSSSSAGFSIPIWTLHVLSSKIPHKPGSHDLILFNCEQETGLNTARASIGQVSKRTSIVYHRVLNSLASARSQTCPWNHINSGHQQVYAESGPRLDSCT